MSAAEVLQALDAVGVKLSLKGEKLAFTGPKGAYDEQRRRLVAENKVAIVALLAAPVAVTNRNIRDHLYASVGDEGLVGRYGAKTAGELMALVVAWERDGNAEVAAAYFEAWLRAEASPRPEVLRQVEASEANTASGTPSEVLRSGPRWTRRQWSPEMQELAAWCLELRVNELPTAPFKLRPGHTVTNSARYLEALKVDVAAGPTHPRNVVGCLEEELQALRDVVRQLEEAF